MNKFIESAIISNVKTQFPTSKVYTGKVVAGIQPNDIVINTVTDNLSLAQSNYRSRHTVISVSMVQPTEDVIDTLVACLQSFTAEGVTHYPDSLEAEDEDSVIRVLIDLTHIER